MRIRRKTKYILLASLILVYATGVLTWFLSHWYLHDSGFGPEVSPFRLFWLQMHSSISLFFMIVFGYILHSHVLPSWRGKRRRLSGAVLTGTIGFLCLTVPGLFYIANESLKNSVAIAHTYVGLCAALVFFVHYFSRQN